MKLKLSDIYDLQMGKTPARKSPEFWGGNNAWVSISDMSADEKYISTTREGITDEAVERTGIKIVPKGTLLMSFKLSVGKVAITEADIYTNEAIMAFIDKGDYGVDINFMYHLFQGIDWTVGTNKAVKGLTLNKDTLSEKIIDLPPLDKQREIAQTLDYTAKVNAVLKTLLSRYDDLVKSRFVEMFGDPVTNPMRWEILSWRDVFETTTGKLDSNAAVEGGRYPFFTCAKEPFAIDTYAFDCEALLLAGNNAAGVYDVKHYSGKFNAYQRTYVLQLKHGKWKYELFKHQLEGRLTYLQSQSIGSNTKYLTLGILHKLKFIVPPLALQNQFADFVQLADKSKFAVQRSIDTLQTLKAKLMQEYFG